LPAVPSAHPLPGRRRALIAAAVLVAGIACAGATFAAVSGEVANVDTVAERQLRPVGDLAVVFDVGAVDEANLRSAANAAAAAGGTATASRSGSLGMRAITRGGTTVHAPPSGYLVPTTYVAVPEQALGRIFGTDLPPLLDSSSVALNELTASLTGARVGDTIVMQAANGSAVPLRIAAIRPYAQLGGSELVFDYDVAVRLGATYDTRVVMHDFDRAKLDQAIAAEGIEARRDTRVSRSWDPANPDDTLSTARTKAVLGEPFYRFNADGSVSMHPEWLATNLTPGRELLNASIPIRARCHVRIVADLRAALAEVAAAGLAGAIDVANANTYGGCYGGARFSRLSDSQIGYLSRHTYGQALDTNTTSNCQGCVPRMNCDVVRIFRRHGFAWGGNFRRADGMHFEWVGERRDQIAYDSRYCPNKVNGTTQSAGTPLVGTEVLIAGIADVGDHSHAP
jgi:D-alanyl-D-alanine carboxypeptidase